jgi:outer membrane protein OmpA-like peptidoglycan-associated protein
MTLLEKIQKSGNDKVFTLYKEGLFYKCYNEDALVFTEKVKNYKVSAKYIKSVGADVLSLGFPNSVVKAATITFDAIAAAIGATSYYENVTAVVPVEKYDDQELKKRIEDLERKNADIDKVGVPDYMDLQNDTIYGLKVDAQGRFIDENKNGIPDETEENLENIKPFSATDDPEYNAIMEFEYNIMYYDLSRVDPNKESRQKLKFVIDYLQKHPEYKVQLNGYTDNLGTVQSNNLLSDRRVAKLKSILESFNISGDRINIEGKGIDTTFSFSNNGQPLARRVNIIILK